MENTSKRFDGAEPISRSSILRLLYDREGDGDESEEDWLEGSEGLPEGDVEDGSNGEGGSLVAGDASLEEVRAWLDAECAKVQDGLDEPTSPKRSRIEALAGENFRTTFEKKHLGMNTRILERIRRGEGPRDTVYEDLIAPLRLGRFDDANTPSGMEPFDDLLAVLLTWNRHVTTARDGTEGRELLIAALHERLKAVDKVLEIIKDKRASEMYDRVGQEAILEPSARRILHALHTYRPETAGFKNQDPIDMLVVLWANTRPEVTDIKTDDELKYLTLKVLAAEKGLAQGYVNEGLRRQIERRRDSARQRKDKAEFLRLEKKKEQYEKEVAKQSVQSSIDQILAARRELRKAELNALQDLTVRQAAQKQAVRHTFQTSSEWTTAPNWMLLHNACAQADLNLDRARRLHLDDLDASAQVAANNIQAMRCIHDKVLTRTLKIGGHDLNRLDEGTRRRIVEERKNQPVTARMMSETLRGVLESKRGAGQMLGQVGAMERALGEVLDAARGWVREWDGFVGAVDGDLV